MPGNFARYSVSLVGLGLGGVDEKSSGDSAVVFDRLQQLLFVLLAHARQFADLAFARQLFHAIDVADLIGAPDQGDRLRSQTLDLQQLQHRWVIFLEQFGLHAEAAFLEQLLQVDQHAFADAGDGQHLLGFGDDVFDLLGKVFDGLGGVAVGADAEGILAVDFEQVGGLVENRGDGFVVHVLKIKQDWGAPPEGRRSLDGQNKRWSLVAAPPQGRRISETDQIHALFVTFAACGPF
jgi:hypothetical protein